MTAMVDVRSPVEVYTKAEIDAMFSTIGTPLKRHVPVVYTLFGPAHMQATLSQSVGPNWSAVGSCLTCSSVQFPAGLGKVVVAFLRVLWNPINANCALRLVKHDNGPTNIEELGVVPGVNQAPGTVRNDGIIVTNQIQEIADAGAPKNLLFQMKDDGTPWQLFAVRLEVTWEV